MSRYHDLLAWTTTVLILLSIPAAHFDYTGISLLLTLTSLGLMLWRQTMMPALQEEHRKQYIARLQERGLYPVDSRVTDANIARLKQEGEKMLAIRLWLEIHGGSLHEAKRAVDRM